ncbi:hypothetical protein GCM10014715_89180 [Streptomyces spiralis]|uniref:Uncharacterized protein n=1 Tax=Streptomyces spiralis TaxID=66376 RepID=A0A919ARU6_9ACTN|nr:hypothetical protein GCM10014715_89180 [Streptomyces spiralis]
MDVLVMVVPFQADGLSGSRHRARADGQNRDDAFPASPYRDTPGQPETSNAPSPTGGSTQCDQDTAVRDLRSQTPPQDGTRPFSIPSQPLAPGPRKMLNPISETP